MRILCLDNLLLVFFVFFNPTVDGKYSAWSNYDACSVSCGGGSQRRERNCNNPVPQHGGKSCQGPTEETRSCNNQECPGK